ncbi:MAG: permease-like cell division protein FtsX [Candidatus Pacebacteria bacterium]|nr:permease-like cell division protein FtsX [Candidatus Paceibacterota bacterium]
MVSSLKSIIKFGWNGFSRNKLLSFQAIFIMAVVVLTTASLFLFKGLTNFLIEEIEKRVDIVVSFKREVPEEDILKVKEDLYNNLSGEVESVTYISKERALEVFKQKHANDPVYQKALEELQDNPLLPSLNIKASNLNGYANIANFLKNEQFGNLVNRVSYNDETHRKSIEKLIIITSGVKKVGLGISIILGILVILITYNTVKLSIFSLRDEITTMRLVGASNMFIQGPFWVQTVICGIFAVTGADLLLFFGVFYLNSKLSEWLLQFNILNYFQESLLLLLGIQIGLVVVLGIFSTFLASRKYLKV